MARTKLPTEGSVWSRIGELAARTDTTPPAAEEIADRIQNLILTENIPEGERLPSERDMAELLGTSRPTVSQATRILVARGLIESRRGSGAYVSWRPEYGLESGVRLMLDVQEVTASRLNEFRLWLETAGVLAAIERANDSDLTAVEEALDELIRNAGSTAAWVSADTRFHATIVRASKNPYLTSIYESVHAALITYEYDSWIETGTVPPWLEKSRAESLAAVHEPILTAVRARDPERARAAVRMHHEAMALHLLEREGFSKGTPE